VQNLLRVGALSVLASGMLIASPAKAQHSNIAPDLVVQVPHLPASVLNGSGAVGDFDGDRQADFAVTAAQRFIGRGQGYRVDVHLTAERSTSFDVASRSAGGLHIAAVDVDGDHDLDLVITSEFGREPIGVWINDGRGGFSQGDAAAYPNSIWRQSDRFVETAARPPGNAVVFGCPVAGWVICHSNLTLPVPSSALRFRPTADRPAPTVANPASPFRAPPLS
jgi:hypothetical protein